MGRFGLSRLFLLRRAFLKCKTFQNLNGLQSYLLFHFTEGERYRQREFFQLKPTFRLEMTFLAQTDFLAYINCFQFTTTHRRLFYQMQIKLSRERQKHHPNFITSVSLNHYGQNFLKKIVFRNLKICKTSTNRGCRLIKMFYEISLIFLQGLPKNVE